MMRYLWLCEEHHLTDHKAHLMDLAADKAVEDLDCCEYTTRLQITTQLDLMKTRCKLLQDEKDKEKSKLIDTGRTIRKLKSAVRGLPSLVFALPEQCRVCVPCPDKVRPCQRPSNYVWCCGYSSSSVGLSSLKRSFCQRCIAEKALSIIKSLQQLSVVFKDLNLRPVDFGAYGYITRLLLLNHASVCPRNCLVRTKKSSECV